MKKVTYIDNFLYVNSQKIECSQVIKEVLEFEKIIVVLLNPNAKTDKKKKYRNLIAYDYKGQYIWSADLPKSRMVNDAYWKISSKSPLIVKSFSSNDCTIDIKNGEIKEISFYK